MKKTHVTSISAILLALVFGALYCAQEALSLDVYGELKAALAEKLASDPANTEARFYYNTTSHVLKYYDGTSWKTAANTATALSNPMTGASGTGDMIYGDGTGAAVRLGPNTTTTAKFLSQTGTGSAGQAPSWAQVDLTTGVTGTLPTGNGGTNQTTWHAGNIPYLSGATTFGEDNGKLVWDGTNHRLGINTASPGYDLEVAGNGYVNGSSAKFAVGISAPTSRAFIVNESVAGAILAEISNTSATGSGLLVETNGTTTQTLLELTNGTPADALLVLANGTTTVKGPATISETTGGTGNVPHNCTRRTHTSGTNASSDSVTCSSGEKAFGGGCSVGGSSSATLHNDYPSADNVWNCDYNAGVGVSATITTTAMCCTY